MTRVATHRHCVAVLIVVACLPALTLIIAAGMSGCKDVDPDVVADMAGDLTVSPAEVDLGTVSADEGVIVHTVSIDNRAKEDAELLLVETSCGCTTAEVSRRVIEPGASMDIAVQVVLRDLDARKPLLQTVDLRYRIGERVVQRRVTLRGRLVQPWDVEPLQLELGDGEQSLVRLKNPTDRDFTIIQALSDTEGVRVLPDAPIRVPAGALTEIGVRRDGVMDPADAAVLTLVDESGRKRQITVFPKPEQHVVVELGTIGPDGSFGINQFLDGYPSGRIVTVVGQTPQGWDFETATLASSRSGERTVLVLTGSYSGTASGPVEFAATLVGGEDIHIPIIVRAFVPRGLQPPP